MPAITDEQLFKQYLPDPMREYFIAKFEAEDVASVETKIAECVKFLCIVSNDELKGEITFSPEIDEVWHYWILQTREYMELCKKLPSGQFVHHNSLEYARAVDMEMPDPKDVAVRNINFFATYISNFGALKQEVLDYWPAASEIMSISDWNLETFNKTLGTVS